MGSQPSVETLKQVSSIRNEMSFHAYLWLIFLLRVGVFLKNSESGRRYMEPRTEGLPHICPLLTFMKFKHFSLLSWPMWIQAKPLPTFLDLLSTKTQNIHGFFPRLSHFSLSNPVFHMFNLITIILPSFTSTSFEEPVFFWFPLNQSHTFLKSSFTASLRQATMYYFSSHWCMYIKLLFYFFETFSEACKTWLTSMPLQDPVSDFTAVRHQTGKTDKKKFVISSVSSFLFLPKRDLILCVSHTLWSPVTVRSLHLKLKADENTCYRIADFSQTNCFAVWHSCLSKSFKLYI